MAALWMIFPKSMLHAGSRPCYGFRFSGFLMVDLDHDRNRLLMNSFYNTITQNFMIYSNPCMFQFQPWQRIEEVEGQLGEEGHDKKSSIQ